MREAASLPRLYTSRATGPDDISIIGGHIYLTLLTAGQVVELSPSGATTNIASGLDHPEGTAPGGDSSLLVVEQGRNRILRLRLDGKGTITPLKTFAKPAARLGIDSIRTRDDGRVVVPDSPNGQLLQLDPSTGAVTTLAGGLGRPVDALPYQGGYAVADEQLGLVLIPSGSRPAQKTTRLPQVHIADDVQLSRLGELVLTSLGDHAIYRLRQGRPEVIARGLSDPQGLAIDSDGSALVVDSSIGAVMRLPAACVET
jgi:sugar lactone lactonase YvrE